MEYKTSLPKELENVFNLYSIKHSKANRRLRVKVKTNKGKIRTLWCGKIVPGFSYWISYISSCGEIHFINQYTGQVFIKHMKGIEYNE